MQYKIQKYRLQMRPGVIIWYVIDHWEKYVNIIFGQNAKEALPQHEIDTV